MNPILCLAALAMLTGLAQADVRKFTQKDTGKTISGEIRSANTSAGTVTIALATGKTLSFKQDMLAESDRKFIAAWAKENAFATSVSFSVSKAAGERTTGKAGQYQIKKQQDGYKITVRNSSSTEKLESLTVKYTMVIDRGGEKVETKSGSHKIAALAPGGSTDFTTGLVDLSVGKVSLSSCPKCVAKAAEFEEDDLEGVYILIEKDGKKGAETVFPTTREKKVREAISGGETNDA